MEDIVGFDLAKLAYEKGFDLPCREAYDSEYKELNSSIFYNGNQFFEIEDIENALTNSGHTHYLAPTQSQLQMWLSNKYNIIVVAFPHYDADYEIWGQDIIWDTLWSYAIWDAFKFNKDATDFQSYGDALEDGLTEALKIIKTK